MTPAVTVAGDDCYMAPAVAVAGDMQRGARCLFHSLKEISLCTLVDKSHGKPSLQSPNVISKNK